MAQRLKFEFLATGFWLGASQVALTFHLLYSQGASVIYYFGLIFLWLLSAVFAIHFVNGSKFNTGLKLASIFSFALAAYFSRIEPFTNLSLTVLLLSVVIVGIFSGYFFIRSVELYSNVSTFLLYENNGFIIGYGLGGCLLFSSIMTVDLVAVGSGLIVLALDFVFKESSSSN